MKRFFFVAMVAAFSSLMYVGCSPEELNDVTSRNQSPSSKNRPEAASGAIKVVVGPAEYGISLHLSDNESAPVEFLPDETGLITVNELPEGVYTVVLRSSEASILHGTSEVVFDNVQVVAGETTDLGTVIFD
ncbi:MAG TPA: hypothetical protein VEB63_09590 [Chitinophagaceae bacterium]|nr:hypothetical protein [Chitinophagaceae bacterium]